MRWVRRTAIGVFAALTVCACSPNSSKTVTSTIGPVTWKDYEPGLQARIDAMASAKDCDGLQSEFNAIGSTNLAVRNAHGHGNEEILHYIDVKENGANCFGQIATTTTP